MKRKKAQVEKASAGTIVGAKMRAQGNKLTDGEREKLGEEFLKLYYGGELKPATTHRRCPACSIGVEENLKGRMFGCDPTSSR